MSPLNKDLQVRHTLTSFYDKDSRMSPSPPPRKERMSIGTISNANSLLASKKAIKPYVKEKTFLAKTFKASPNSVNKSVK